MFTLFYEGGALFMGLLTLLLLIILCLAVVAGVKLLGKDAPPYGLIKPQLNYIKAVGLFALVTGILGQLIGLYSGLQSIENTGGITPAILASGFRVSSICNLYGLLIFLIAYALWFGLDVWLNRKFMRQ